MRHAGSISVEEKGYVEGGYQMPLVKMTVGEMLDASADVSFFDHDVPFQKVLEQVALHSPKAVIVRENGSLTGILTLRDVLAGLRDFERLREPVGTFMSAPLHVFSESESVAGVLQCMEDFPFNKIVVVDASHAVRGVLDKRYLAAQLCQKLSPLIKHYDDDIRILLKIAGERSENLLEMAMTDPLTSVANRRLFSEIFRSHLAVSKRLNSAFSLMIIDIDDFKGINDTHGHNVGDNVLVELVDVLMSHIRDADVLARWGGDEFVILLHMTEEEGIKTMAEHLRRTIERYRFKDVGHLTCSFGIAEVGGQANLESAIALADKALYQAKQKGKNGVTYTKDGATFC